MGCNTIYKQTSTVFVNRIEYRYVAKMGREASIKIVKFMAPGLEILVPWWGFGSYNENAL